MSKNLFVSFMRTAVPLAVGWVLAATDALGIPADDTAVRDGVAMLLAAAYYALFRLAEELAGRLDVPWLERLAGMLLGWARPPDYPRPAGASAGAPLSTRDARGGS